MDERQQYTELLGLVTENNNLIFAGDLLRRTAQRYPDKVALICNGSTITFADLYKRASALSHILVSRGIKPGDRVFTIFENSMEFYIAYYGVWQTGAVVVPLNTFLHEREWHHMVRDANPVAIVAADKFVKSFQGLVPLVLTEKDMPVSAAIPAEQAAFQPPQRDPDEMTVLLYTSGTTGSPKGVMLSSRNILTNTLQGIVRLGVNSEERIFAVLPLFHSFAQNSAVWSTVLLGATTIIVQKIDRTHILVGLKHEPTIFLGVPALYGILCLMRTAPLDSVRYFVSGGDSLPDKLRSAFGLIYGRKICNGYGLTEATPVIAIELADTLLPATCVGKPVLDVSCSIRTEDGQEVPQGTIGLLWVKGPNIMLGYYQAPEHTAQVIVDGWLNTGDLAKVDEQGRLHICGRLKDLIIHKGFNIYPQEIENIIMTHSAVVGVGVVGKPDTVGGEIPVAFVAVKAQAPGLADEIRTLCLQNLAAYKVPRQVICLEQLPVTAMGKVDKKKLKKDYFGI